MEPGIRREWIPVLNVHPSTLRPDCLTHYAWLQFPDGRVRGPKASQIVVHDQARADGIP
jgi:hypothetical protein